ncbi:cytochrome c [Alisedimentitalea sp. MJ-SS2]|uniref:c-type cytochrome n=1 Tax=Aliisedimentitalea sp. MJ-SS2 TaxID=3049795 RepID=UPI00290FD08D|nr:cytochrome c [Alisedimentitalea sp. MJ-SS2]MDU8929832.1 cytochrome c [Alisedimentitalea sp. MJ-SS2]
MKQPLAAAVLAWLAYASPGLSQEQPENSDPSRGANLYAESCASCHGVDLEGQPNWRTPDENGVLPAPPHDKTGHTWHHDDTMLFSYTKLGGQITLERAGITSAKSGMPGFEESLSDQDIWDILAYIKSTWPKRERMAQQQRTEAMKWGSD